ncbi:MAG: hypothetical protein ACI8P3_001100 [Saprospiraceae bacterium]|jgi:hypothetical protein
MSENLNWNFEEFTSYLLLYASNADLEITADEEALIHKRISESQYKSIRAEFDKASDYERIQHILSYKGLYFPTEDRARELMDLVISLFKVDGHFSSLEANSFRLLKRLI